MNGNSANKITFRRAYEAQRCRRRRRREKLEPTAVKAWSAAETPSSVSVIEVDRRGARVVLPWDSAAGEFISVSLANHIGEYRTTKARVAWSQTLPNTTSVVVGLAFEEEVVLAA